MTLTPSRLFGFVAFLGFGALAADAPAAEASGPPPSVAQPNAESRILKIIHGWPDEPAAQDALIRSLAGRGFGGVVCNVSFAEYLESEAKWKALARALGAAKAAGFTMWVYDEKGYPSGTAGGLVLRDHPEWQAQGLLIADAESEGGPVALEIPPGKGVLTAGFPVRDGEIDLKGGTNLSEHVADGKLSWTAPPGRWRVMAITESRLFEGTHASMSYSDHIPYPNLLEPEPTARFLELTHQAYANHLGPNLGRWFVSTFTDEPSLMSLFLRPMPYRVLPWAPHLAEEFERRRGYALEPLLPALVAEAGAAGRRARHDFWLTVAELVSENYFGQIRHWCDAHGLLSGGHLLMEESLVNQVPLYGDFFRCQRRMSAQGIDCLTSLPNEVPWFIARLVSSAADLEGRSITMCETSDFHQQYRAPSDKRPVRPVTEAEIRGTCNRLMVDGIVTITSYYSFQGLEDEQVRRLNEWVGRCAAALKGGNQVADLAVVYPTESVWPRFVPSHHHTVEATAAARVEKIYHNVSETLFTAGRDFMYVDGRALAEAAVEGGALRHGGLRWRVVILPGADSLPLAAWENLARFVVGGGIVVAVGALPANSESEFPSPRVQALGAAMFGPGGTADSPRAQATPAGGGGIFLPQSSAALLPMVLKGILKPEVEVSGAGSPVRATHRRIGGQEIFFLINDSDKPWQGTISLAAKGPGEQCDPATGTAVPLAASEAIPLSLGVRGGALFRFSGARSPALSKLRSGPLPGLHLRALPAVSPTVAQGEFVRGELGAPAAGSGAAAGSWRACGTLTKGGVDTFLFVGFPYAQPPALAGIDCLVIDSLAPEGQRAPTELLVILHQSNGADYLAATGRSLGAPGFSRACVPLSRFRLAGWSKDDGGGLNLSAIKEIRIGWGGYYGSQGEKIEFTLAPPQTAAVP